MKKILCFALGALFCFSSFALTQMTMKNGKIDSQLTPMKIGNICVFNPGGQYGVLEDVKLERLDKFDYARPIPAIVDEGGTVTTNFHETMIGCFYYSSKDMARPVYCPITLNRVPGNDPNAYEGTGEGKFVNYSDGEIYPFKSNVTMRITIKTKTNPENYNISVYGFATNIVNEESIRLDYGFGNHEEYSGSFNITTKVYENENEFDSRMFGIIPNTPASERMIGTIPYTYKSKVATTLCQYNVGTALYGATNINVVIPANTTIRCKCKDDQTEVAVIYE